MKATTVIQL